MAGFDRGCYLRVTNADVVEPELRDVLKIRRSGESSQSRDRVVPAFGKPAADGNLMLQVLESLPSRRTALCVGRDGLGGGHGSERPASGKGAADRCDGRD